MTNVIALTLMIRQLITYHFVRGPVNLYARHAGVREAGHLVAVNVHVQILAQCDRLGDVG